MASRLRSRGQKDETWTLAARQPPETCQPNRNKGAERKTAFLKERCRGRPHGSRLTVLDGARPIQKVSWNEHALRPIPTPRCPAALSIVTGAQTDAPLRGMIGELAQ